MTAPRNIAASARQRLLEISKRQAVDFDSILVRFAVERLLARLSKSAFADRFVLKGAMLFAIWSSNTHRPTRDVDFLGFGSSDAGEIADIFRQLLTMDFEPDGLIFQVATLSVAPIRAVDAYGGLEVKFIANLDNARISVQIDIGFGDVISPGPETVNFPNLLPDFASPIIRAYPIYTAFAEKFEAAVRLGDANGRMKDFFDMWYILQNFPVDSDKLRTAIAATFARRATPPPVNIPRILTHDFAALKEPLWKQFLNRNGLREPAGGFANLLDILRRKLIEN